MEDKSEQLEGDIDRLPGKVIGPRFCWTLGGRVGGGGEPEGVEVLGDLEGVFGTITDTRSLSLGINSKLSSWFDNWRVRIFSRACPSPWKLWLRVSLLILPRALDRSDADRTSWKVDTDASFLTALVFCRESSASFSVLCSTLIPTYSTGQRWRGERALRGDNIDYTTNCGPGSSSRRTSGSQY